MLSAMRIAAHKEHNMTGARTNQNEAATRENCVEVLLKNQ